MTDVDIWKRCLATGEKFEDVQREAVDAYKQKYAAGMPGLYAQPVSNDQMEAFQAQQQQDEIAGQEQQVAAEKDQMVKQQKVQLAELEEKKQALSSQKARLATQTAARDAQAAQQQPQQMMQATACHQGAYMKGYMHKAG